MSTGTHCYCVAGTSFTACAGLAKHTGSRCFESSSSGGNHQLSVDTKPQHSLQLTSADLAVLSGTEKPEQSRSTLLPAALDYPERSMTEAF